MKRIIITAILIAAMVASYFLLKKDRVTTLDPTETQFAVEDISKIDLIYLRSRFLNTEAVLNKIDDEWYINKKFKADPAKVNVLLTAIRDVQVKYPVSKDFWNPVIKSLASQGTKVEIYSGKNKLKTYYVGNPTPDHMGTFYWMENAKKPYVVHIEGFQGYMTPRFFVSEKDWRSKVIFKYTPEEIASVSISWTENPEQSFTIDNTSGKPTLISESNPNPINDNLVRSYLNYFEKLAYEGFPETKTPEQIDSIYHKTDPFAILTLITTEGDTQELRFHYKELTRSSYAQLDIEGVQLPFDLDSYYAFLNQNAVELLQVQDFVFGKVLKQAQDFSVKKD